MGLLSLAIWTPIAFGALLLAFGSDKHAGAVRWLALVGALAGGLLGNQIGGGTGKKVATVAGAAAGGYAGNQVQGNMQANDTYTTTETRCSTVTDTSEKVVGYDVRYNLDGKEGTVRMERDPGSQIPVDKEGRLILGQNQQ